MFSPRIGMYVKLLKGRSLYTIVRLDRKNTFLLQCVQTGRSRVATAQQLTTKGVNKHPFFRT